MLGARCFWNEWMSHTNYVDSDLAFHMRIFRDLDRARRSGSLLRKHFPKARIFLIADGDFDPGIGELAESLQAECHYDQRLYTFGTGGQMIHRMLEYFFRDPRKWLIKIDPDTGIYRRPSYLPSSPGIFGTIQYAKGVNSIQGGFIGMNFATAKTLLESKAFLCPSLLNPEESYVKNMPLQIEYVAERGIAEDWLLSYVIQKLSLSCFDFSEVKCRWKQPVSNRWRRYAFVHPCKSGIP